MSVLQKLQEIYPDVVITEKYKSGDDYTYSFIFKFPDETYYYAMFKVLEPVKDNFDLIAGRIQGVMDNVKGVFGVVKVTQQ